MNHKKIRCQEQDRVLTMHHNLIIKSVQVNEHWNAKILICLFCLRMIIILKDNLLQEAYLNQYTRRLFIFVITQLQHLHILSRMETRNV